MQKKYSRRTFLAASAAAALLLTGCSGSPEDPAPSNPDSATPSPEPEPDDSIEKPADSNTETVKDIVWIIQPNNDGSGTAYITGYEKSGPQPRGQVIIPDTYYGYTIIINGGTFGGCTSLSRVYIPKSIRYINAYAFNDCSALRSVCYGGTETEWHKINLSADHNSCLLAASRSYSVSHNAFLTQQ